MCVLGQVLTLYLYPCATKSEPNLIFYSFHNFNIFLQFNKFALTVETDLTDLYMSHDDEHYGQNM
jgi:hypothetical protein